MGSGINCASTHLHRNGAGLLRLLEQTAATAESLPMGRCLIDRGKKKITPSSGIATDGEAASYGCLSRAIS